MRTARRKRNFAGLIIGSAFYRMARGDLVNLMLARTIQVVSAGDGFEVLVSFADGLTVTLGRFRSEREARSLTDRIAGALGPISQRKADGLPSGVGVRYKSLAKAGAYKSYRVCMDARVAAYQRD